MHTGYTRRQIFGRGLGLVLGLFGWRLAKAAGAERTSPLMPKARTFGNPLSNFRTNSIFCWLSFCLVSSSTSSSKSFTSTNSRVGSVERA